MTKTLRPEPTVAVPRAPLTVEQYFALGDDDFLRGWELQEGNVVMSPLPRPPHMRASGELYVQLRHAIPSSLAVFQEVDVDLQLVAADRPGTVRGPDLVVVPAAAYERVRRDRGIFRAADVLLAVEIVSPSSRRLDRLVKRDEYADAGIERYWVIDLDPRPSLVEHRLGDDGRYLVRDAVVGAFTADLPFPIALDLDALV